MAICWDKPVSWVGKDVWILDGCRPSLRRVVEVYPNQRHVALKGMEKAVPVRQVFATRFDLEEGCAKPGCQDDGRLFPIVMCVLAASSVVAAYLLN